MKVAFDTSVLVAGSLAAHPDHASASAWLDALADGVVSGFWTAHAWAETWCVLTRVPLADRLAPADATAVVDSLAALVAPTPLTLEDYQAAAARCADVGVRSGALFDAIHLVAAERAGVDLLLTFNLKDFVRLKPGVKVSSPAAEPLPPG